MDTALLTKYNVAVPRYTSYPTVPYWQDNIDADRWKHIFQRDFAKGNSLEGISLYIHLPFCESLCTYCGCNKKITTNHSVESTYIAAIHKEWLQYLSLMDEPPIIRELHLGGGTPTFFSPDNLFKLLEPIFLSARIHRKREFSFEGHPNNTTREHLEALYQLGFRRVSYGVQDNDPIVQKIINRIQPFENVKNAIEMARGIGYQSVNFDLIYGLPRQTRESITRTVNETLSLRPDRIAFYSYAHVPWTSRGQRLFDENDLPPASEKLAMYQLAKELFVDAGYHDIGMDHFALDSDDLFIAGKEGRLHRNFMGYTTQNTSLLLGLGVSAISATEGAYIQNGKVLHNYYAALDEDHLAAQKGHFLTDEDNRFGKYIIDISCSGCVRFAQEDMETIKTYCYPILKGMEEDKLVKIKDDCLYLTAKGKNFTRNICSAFDLHLIRDRHHDGHVMFSRSV